MSQDVLTQDERAAVRDYLQDQGVSGRVRFSTRSGRDELVLVLSRLAGVKEELLTRELQELLHRKVWIAGEGPEWEGALEEL